MSIKAIFFSFQDVGKTIKSSKRRYTWKFNIDKSTHTIELFVSSLSGKKKVTVDGVSEYDESKFGAFQFTYELRNCTCIVYETHDSYDLRINSQSFSHLYTVEKTKKNFDFEDGYKESSSKQEESNKPKPKAKQQIKNNGSDEDVPDYGFDHGFESLAPKDEEKERQVPRQATQNQKQDDSQGFQSQFSNKPIVSSQPKNSQFQPTEKNQPMKKPMTNNAFGDFGDFGQKTTTTSKDPFQDFSNFKFDEKKQEQKPNPFAPSIQTQPRPQENLLDFQDEAPIQQNKQFSEQGKPANNSQANQKNIPQDLLDLFDEPSPQLQNQIQSQNSNQSQNQKQVQNFPQSQQPQYTQQSYSLNNQNQSTSNPQQQIYQPINPQYTQQQQFGNQVSNMQAPVQTQSRMNDQVYQQNQYSQQQQQMNPQQQMYPQQQMQPQQQMYPQQQVGIQYQNQNKPISQELMDVFDAPYNQNSPQMQNQQPNQQQQQIQQPFYNQKF